MGWNLSWLDSGSQALNDIGGFGRSGTDAASGIGGFLYSLTSIPSYLYRAFTGNSVTHAQSEVADMADRNATVRNAQDQANAGNFIKSHPAFLSDVADGREATGAINEAVTGHPWYSYLWPPNWFSHDAPVSNPPQYAVNGGNPAVATPEVFNGGGGQAPAQGATKQLYFDPDLEPTASADPAPSAQARQTAQVEASKAAAPARQMASLTPAEDPTIAINRRVMGDNAFMEKYGIPRS